MVQPCLIPLHKLLVLCPGSPKRLVRGGSVREDFSSVFSTGSAAAVTGGRRGRRAGGERASAPTTAPSGSREKTSRSRSLGATPVDFVNLEH